MAGRWAESETTVWLGGEVTAVAVFAGKADVTGAVRALVYPVPEVGVVVHAFNIRAATCGWGKGGEAAPVVLERVGRSGGDWSPIWMRRMSGETL